MRLSVYEVPHYRVPGKDGINRIYVPMGSRFSRDFDSIFRATREAALVEIKEIEAIRARRFYDPSFRSSVAQPGRKQVPCKIIDAVSGPDQKWPVEQKYIDAVYSGEFVR